MCVWVGKGGVQRARVKTKKYIRADEVAKSCYWRQCSCWSEANKPIAWTCGIKTIARKVEKHKVPGALSISWTRCWTWSRCAASGWSAPWSCLPLRLLVLRPLSRPTMHQKECAQCEARKPQFPPRFVDDDDDNDDDIDDSEEKGEKRRKKHAGKWLRRRATNTIRIN